MRRPDCPRQDVLVFTLLSFCAVLLTSAGCGTVAYEQKINASIVRLRLNAPFLDLHEKAVADIEGVGLQFRLPKLITDKNATAIDGAWPKKYNGFDPPPRHRFPGHLRTYEVQLPYKTDTNTTLIKSCQIYVAMIPKDLGGGKRKTAAALAKEIRDTLIVPFGPPRKEEPPKGKQEPPIFRGTSEWETVNLPTPFTDPSGQPKTISLKKMRAVGDRLHRVWFYRYKQTNDGRVVDRKNNPGTYLLYLHTPEKQDHHVLLGWRTENDIFAGYEIEKLADAMAGTLAFGEPYEKPVDFSELE